MTDPTNTKSRPAKAPATVYASRTISHRPYLIRPGQRVDGVLPDEVVEQLLERGEAWSAARIAELLAEFHVHANEDIANLMAAGRALPAELVTHLAAKLYEKEKPPEYQWAC